MEAVTLSDLWPIVVSVLGPMLLCVTALARYQHLDSVKIHKLIADSNEKNRDLIETSSKENRDLIETSSKENRDLIDRATRENRELIMKNHTAISDVRERLARIEGYLRISPPPHQGAGDGDGDAKAA